MGMSMSMGMASVPRKGGTTASPSAPENTGLPVISGTPTQGETLSTTNGTWTGFPAPSFTYQWERDAGDISGATSATYELVEDDVDALITVTVTATNASGSDDATSEAVGPVEGLPGATISAPLDVTWIDETNPPEFNMNIDWDAPGDVQVGDVPKIQFNGTGTIYEGEPVAVVGGPLTFPTMPTLDPGDYTAIVWFDRIAGGPGEVLGAHSDPSPEFTIEATEFTLEGLFANGEKGALYDFSDLTTLFQTTDTSTPVTADGQSIGRVNDKSGNGNHLTQASSGSRPAYKTAGGLHWLDNYGHFLASGASVDLSDGPVLTIILGLADGGKGSAAYIQINNGTDTLASPGAEVSRAFSSPNPWVRTDIVGNVGNNLRWGPNTLVADDDWDRHVLRAVLDFSQATAATEVAQFVNGSSVGSESGSSNNTNTNFGTGRTISLMGRNAGGGPQYDTRCYAALIINRALTTEETAAAEAAMAALAGVTL